MCGNIEMMHRRLAVICIALLLGCERNEDAKPAASQSTRVGLQSIRAPRFEDFPADTFVGRPAPVDLTSDSDAPHFRTRLSAGAAEGPNFAGHFTIITWGCGTQCVVDALVDARSGRVYSDTTLDFSCYDPEFRRNSTLVIQRPDTALGACSGTGTRFFRWTGDRFVDVITPAL